MLGEGFREFLGIERGAGFERGAGRAQRGGRGGFAGKRVAAAEDCAVFRAGEDFQNGEPLGGGLGIGDGAVTGLGGRVWKDEGVDAPEFHLGGEALTVAWHVANQPDARFFPVAGCFANERCEKRVGRLGGVVEHEFSFTGGQGGQA